jgi:hypothetical protein
LLPPDRCTEAVFQLLICKQVIVQQPAGIQFHAQEQEYAGGGSMYKIDQNGLFS